MNLFSFFFYDSVCEICNMPSPSWWIWIPFRLFFYSFFYMIFMLFCGWITFVCQNIYNTCRKRLHLTLTGSFFPSGWNWIPYGLCLHFNLSQRCQVVRIFDICLQRSLYYIILFIHFRVNANGDGLRVNGLHKQTAY